LPKFKTVGLPEGAVKESKERVCAAIKNTGFIFPHKHVSIFVMGIMIGSFFLAGCNTNKEQFSLTSKSYEMWRDYITPTENELLWTSIPWRSSFREGLIDADEYQKPLLLWAMNGHPLGCT
jgi:hypothetical protein